jgi:uncharacterized protein with FMN-binding domain
MFEAVRFPRAHKASHKASNLLPTTKVGGLALAAFAAVLIVAAGVCADEIQLLGGKRYQGRLIRKTPQSVTFKIVFPSGGNLVTEFAASAVKSLKIDGKEPTFQKPPASLPKPPAVAGPRAEPTTKPRTSPGTAGQGGRTEAEVERQILEAGRTPPEWWEAVELDYPPTLDLAGTKPVKGWAPDRNLGAYMWSVITPNPGRWKEGVRLLHHVLTVRKDDPQRLAEGVRQLAGAYQRLLRDWPRAAFWWQKALAGNAKPNITHVLALAECYWMLGSKSMAMKLLAKYRVDRVAYSGTVKLLAEMGEFRRAVGMAQVVARRWPDEGHLAAGNACRLVGRYKEALAHYGQVLSASQGSGRINRNKQRARESIAAIKLYESLDLSGIRDGTYSGQSAGYRGMVEVEASVQGGRIRSVRVTRHKEDMTYTALTDLPSQIVKKQGVGHVDAVTGATITSEAIINAAAKALAKGMKQ